MFGINRSIPKKLAKICINPERTHGPLSSFSTFSEILLTQHRSKVKVEHCKRISSLNGKRHYSNQKSIHVKSCNELCRSRPLMRFGIFCRSSNNLHNELAFLLNSTGLIYPDQKKHFHSFTGVKRLPCWDEKYFLNSFPKNVERGIHYGKKTCNENNNTLENTNSVFKISNNRSKVRDKTRIILNGRISRLKNSITLKRILLKEKLQLHRDRSILNVNKIKRKLEAKKEDVRTIPNLLTTLRMASAPVLAYLVVHDHFGAACSIFVLAGLTDVLDGYIARNFKNQRTALGTALDPLADKLLVSFLGISLTSAGLIPVPMLALILLRDAGLIVASFYIRYISLAPPKTLSRYFDVSHVTAKLYPSNISKVNTGLQLSYLAATLASPVFDFVGSPWLEGFMYLTAVTTFMSGVDYVLTWRRRLKIIKNN
ncbi:uncharacterized protein LOC131941922 [Physella acuta]|uniref:uncharacterized protein LOC131941922 n=1 Tax=Physella acuta TaxID=109671 RepID=UPI0027DBBFFD|nr:uncharacterized protein LOC131941922 [Physella acuta]